MKPVRRYRSFVSDNARWDGFEHRDGDVVVDTPPKCGTTWMQMCCLVIVHQTPTLPMRLPELSPWVDTVLGPPGRTHELLAAQTHRRVMKTHTPLDGLRLDDRVTYVCVARDPRDVVFSMKDHRANTNYEAVQAARVEGLGAEEAAAQAPPPPPDDVAARFWEWVEDDKEFESSHDSLRGFLHHIDTFWDHRDDSNVELFHYSDLLRDLNGQMRRLAAALGADPDEGLWPELVAAADFEAMRANAEVLSPGLTAGHWIDPAAFFSRGGTGRWHGVIDEGDMPRYDERVRELVPTGLAAWVHHGWLGG